MSDELDFPDEVFQQLRREYLAEAPARLDELRKDLAAACAREPEALASLKARLHKLAGSGGSYGFPAITEASRTGEHWIADHPEPDDAGFAWLGAVVGRIAAAFEDAAREVSRPAAPSRPGGFGWRAHVAGAPAELTGRIADALREAQYSVSTGSLEVGSAGLPVTERPDLLILVPRPEEALAELLHPWLRDVAPQTLGIAMVSDQPLGDLLATFLPGVDLVAGADGADAEIARWARAVGRAAATPLSAVVILPEEAERISVTGWLEDQGMLVSGFDAAEAGLGAISAAAPDFLLLDWGLPDSRAASLVRLVRSAQSTAWIPILALTTPDDDESIRQMLAAGVDAPLVRPVSGDRLVAEATLRAGRTRRLEALLRRDGLTGFLTRSAFEDELESVLAHTRRTGEQVSLVVFDPDHFRRINEQLGRATGDQILRHLAQAIRRRVRASDTGIRIGGEELGILLRQCGPAEAREIAQQIRAGILDHPPIVEGIPFPVRVSAGIASSGQAHTASARDLILEAEHALREAKATGRDRVVVSEAPFRLP